MMYSPLCLMQTASRSHDQTLLLVNGGGGWPPGPPHKHTRIFILYQRWSLTCFQQQAVFSSQFCEPFFTR